MSENPRYSIIIPTFERQNLLANTIKGCLLQDYDDFEVLVSNNYSQDGTRRVLDQFISEARVRVVHTDKKLSMQDHFAFAMKHSRGDYVLVLGDDDGVSPSIFKIMDEVLTKSNANLVRFKSALYYHNDWLGFEKNTLHFSTKSSGDYFSVNIDDVIQSYCNFTGYQFFPLLFHSIYKRELITQVDRVVKHMFVGAPDHSFPFLLLTQPNASLCYVDMVLGFGGRSQNSNAAFYGAKEGRTKPNQKRHTEWATEMDSNTRLPYHEPNINVPGNFVPAAFSYAKFFFPLRLEPYNLDPFELSKIIQKDLEECLCGRRAAWHTSVELENFRKFVTTRLDQSAQKAIFRLRGSFSTVGKVRMLFKRTYVHIIEILSRLSIVNIELNKHTESQRRTFGVRVDLAAEGILESHELVRHFDDVIRRGQSQGEQPSLQSSHLGLRLLGRIDAS